MGDASQLTQAIKKAAQDAMESTKPVNVVFGKVTSAKPLKILVEQKMTLDEAQLILTRSVTDYETEVTVAQKYGWNTKYKQGGSGEESFESHNHDIYFDKKKIKIHNALKVGDEVVLVRQQEGQKFIVLDRLG